MQAKSDNKLLQVRGNAGTHDLQLGQETLEALQSAVSAEAETAVPRYDKSKNEGRGDRAERSSWPHVQGPIDIILFEGWMLGFSPVEEAEVAKVGTCSSAHSLLKDIRSHATLADDMALLIYSF